MNALSHVPEVARCLEKVTVADKYRFARVAGRQAVCVPARSTVFVQAVGGRMGQTAAFEPLTTGCGPLLATNTVVCDHSFMVAVVNSTEDDYWLRPRTRLGVLKPADVLLAGGVRVDVSVNEIVVGVALQQSSSKESSGGTDDNLIDLSHFTGTDDELRAVRALFNRHRVVFAQSDDGLGCTSAVQHRIRTTDDIPVTMTYRRIPLTQLDEVKDHLQRLVRTGAIVESKSDFASAVVLVRKRSGALRMCCDFRALNAKTVKDAYPLPRIDESMPGGSAHWICNRLTPRYRCTQTTNTRLHLPLHLACTNTDEWHSDCATHPPPSSDSCRQLSARKCSASCSATLMMSSFSPPLSLNSSKDWTQCSRD